MAKLHTREEYIIKIFISIRIKNKLNLIIMQQIFIQMHEPKINRYITILNVKQTTSLEKYIKLK